ncbi:formyltransferase [Variovorax robiniae]|uniref:Formyltransferase n=1 Tax=Variovorax robiniae TaxID=1836199 RepID=A0ABU8X6T9_9BURK
MTMANPPASAIVFAYHDVGVRCLRVLLDAGVEVPLVITHEDSPGENIWFASVAQVAAEHGLRCVAPSDAHTPELLAEAAASKPDFLFSFYYRHMLKAAWLNVPSRGAFNMHGSMLPQYRGRVPVNWAIIEGARETGATLHRMNEKPDNGAIVDQCAVPILGDDTASEVFGKVVTAAEIVLARSLPRMIDGTATERVQDLSQGRYYGGRKPEDGRIPSGAGAPQIHNLVRALAAPYPGAFCGFGGREIIFDRTRLFGASEANTDGALRLLCRDDALWLHAADGGMLQVLAAHDGDGPIDSAGFARRFGGRSSVSVDT